MSNPMKSSGARVGGARAYFSKYLGVYLLLLIMVVGMSIISDKFLSVSNVLNILRQISFNAIIAFGMTYCILLGGIDLSVGAVKGSPIACNDEAFTKFGNGYIANVIPAPVVIMLVIFVLVLFLLVRTTFGKHVYAIGGNRDCARYAGINIEKVETLSYTLSGALAGVAGVILAARMYSGQPNAGEGYELNAIAAPVIGGASMTGGIGSVAGTILGALVIGIMNNGLNLMKAQYYYQTIAKGVVILAAVLLDTYKRKLDALRLCHASIGVFAEKAAEYGSVWRFLSKNVLRLMPFLQNYCT